MATRKSLEEAKRQAAAKDTADLNWQSYVRARDNGHKDYMKRAQRFNDYYIGDQWDEATMAALRDGNRPAHTINLILSTVNAVMGEYLSRRHDIVFKPVTGAASPRTAELLTRQYEQIAENNNSAWNETQQVMDGLIEERGFVDIRIDYTDNVQGEVRERVLDNRDVLLDPGAKEDDPETWAEVITSRWWTINEIAEVYGQEKADQLRTLPRESTFGTDGVEFETDTYAQDGGQYLDGSPIVPNGDDDYANVSRVRVIDRQHYKLGEVFCYVDPVLGDERDVPRSWNEQQRDEFAKEWGLIVYRKVKRMVRWTVSAAHVLLHDDWSPYSRFTVFPFFPYFRRGRPIGLVTNLISPQDLLNKTASQELHVVNTSANSGWVFESGSLVNMTREELGQVGAKTGLVLEFARGSTPPEKIQPNQIPTGLDRMTDKAGVWFRMISGVSDSFLGQPGREISGVALDAKNQGVQVQLEIVFDNLAKCQQRKAEFILELIQKFYTDQRMLRLVQRDIDGDEEFEDVALNEYVEATDEILNDLTVGEYKVVVSSTPARDNQDETTFAQLLQLKEVGVLVPDFAVFEASNLRNKHELVQYAKKMAGMLEPTPEEVQKQAIMDEAQLRMMLAQTAEVEAKAQERAANVQLIIAKAQSEGMKIPVEMERLGAELRVEMEKIAEESRRHREDLAARLLIAREKNQSLNAQVMANAAVSRLEQAASERKDQRAVMVKTADLAQRARTEAMKQIQQQRQLEHERRQQQIENAMRMREMSHDQAMAREDRVMQREQMSHDKEMANQQHKMKQAESKTKLQLAKQSAKAKTAAAKKPTAKRK